MEFLFTEKRSDFNGIELAQANRCGTTDEVVARQMNYTEKDVKTFKNRVKSMKTLISKNGVQEASRIIIGVVGERKYFIDGQRRSYAITELNNEKLQRGETNLYEITVDYYRCADMAELARKIREFNTNQNLLGSNNKLRTLIYESGDQELIDCDVRVNEYSEITKVCPSAIRDIMFGQGANKETKINSLRLRNAWSFTPTFMNNLISLRTACEANPMLQNKDIAICTNGKFVNALVNIHKKIDAIGRNTEEKNAMHVELINRLKRFIQRNPKAALIASLDGSRVTTIELGIKEAVKSTISGRKTQNILYHIIS